MPQLNPEKRSARGRLPVIIAISIDAATLIIAVGWLMGFQLPLAGAYRIQEATRIARAAASASPVDPASLQISPSTLEPVTPAQAVLINAAVPISTLPNPPADPFRLISPNPADRPAALTCLTMAVYYEAGNQGDQGEAAVAQVVLNRLRNPMFPKTVCGVVFDGSTLPTGCQFTFTCDGSMHRPPGQAGWRRASQIADRALNGYVEPSVGEATHYHTIWVVPYWQSTVIKVAQIGAHIFYRWPGRLGMPESFLEPYAGLEQAPPPIPGINGDALPADPIATEPTPPPPPTVEAVLKPVAVEARPALAAQLAAPPKLPTAVKLEPLQRAKPIVTEDSNHHLPMPGNW